MTRPAPAPAAAMTVPCHNCPRLVSPAVVNAEGKPWCGCKGGAAKKCRGGGWPTQGNPR